jgi:arabinose-5-phosphate isomerase
MSLIRELFQQQKQILDHFFHTVDCEAIDSVLYTLSQCRGAIVLSGVGKSGLIAQKISATLVSTGTRSYFLSPSNALHGDIGNVHSDDVVICLSKSGSSQELIDLIPFIHQKTKQTIAVISKTASKLEKLCAQTVYLPVQRELCPHDLAPTSSTAIQLIFGDTLAIALMKKRGFGIEDFAANHPAGLLGRKITLRVEDVMLKGDLLPLCKSTDKLIDVLHELSMKRCGCLLIVNERRQLEGIFTDGDLRRSVQSKGAAALESTLQELMTRNAKSISPGKLALHAMQIMEEDPHRLITVLPVLEGTSLVGLLRMHDILQAGL